MKKYLYVVSFAMSMLFVSIGHAESKYGKVDYIQDSEKCQYTLSDAMSGVKDFVVTGFIEKEKTPDGKLVLGLVLYHDPKNANAKSVDAISLVAVEDDEVKVIFLVSYYNSASKSLTTYSRQIKIVDGKQTLGQCFDKKTEKAKQAD